MPMSKRRDLPAVLLAVSVSVFGASRPEWGRAMAAELTGLDGRRTRWVFALGCMRSLAVTLPPPGSRRVVNAAATAAAAASLGVVVLALVRYPGVVSGAGTWVALAAFVAVLAVYVVATAHLTPRLAGGPLVMAVVAGVAIAGSWVGIGLSASLSGPAASSMALVAVGPLVAMAVGWLGTARSGSAGSGVACVGLAGLVAGLGLFLVWAGQAVATGGRPYDAGLLRDFTSSGASDLATYAVNDSLGTAMMLLLLVPLVSLASGLVGTAAASWKVRRTA